MAFNKLIRTSVVLGLRGSSVSGGDDIDIPIYRGLVLAITYQQRRGRFIAPTADLSSRAGWSDVRIQ
jgi:hypothetical protein